MSFNTELKAALTKQLPDELTGCTASLYAMVFSSFALTIRGFGRFGLSYETSYGTGASYAFKLIKNIFNISPELVKMKQKDNFGEKSRYLLSIDDPKDAMEILESLGMITPEGMYVNEGIDTSLIVSDEDRTEFLKGFLIACGYMYDPVKSYCIEFRFANGGNAEAFAGYLRGMDMDARIRQRNSSSIVYLKRLDDVQAYLTLCGAGTYALEVFDRSAMKELILSAQRVTNCDLANSAKSYAVAQEQIRAIDRITSSKGLSSLSAPLLEAARLRLDNPESSLSDLAAISGISRSTLDKRLRRIMNIAEGLK